MTIPQPILVTGAGRSGSSMIAGVLNICGAFGGVMDRHCENIAIRDRATVPFLEGLRVDPAGQYPLPDTNQIVIPADWATRVFDLMRSDGYQTGPWMYKGSRIALMWPVWHYAFPNAKWVIVRRRTGDIVQSCTKTDFMRAFRSEGNQRAVQAKNEVDGWKWWVRQFEQRFVEMIMEGLNCRVIWPERMVYGDYQQIFDTVDWLNLHWTSEVLAYIDPKLYKARRNGHLHTIKPALVEG